MTLADPGMRSKLIPLACRCSYTRHSGSVSKNSSDKTFARSKPNFEVQRGLEKRCPRPYLFKFKKGLSTGWTFPK